MAAGVEAGVEAAGARVVVVMETGAALGVARAAITNGDAAARLAGAATVGAALRAGGGGGGLAGLAAAAGKIVRPASIASWWRATRSRERVAGTLAGVRNSVAGAEVAAAAAGAAWTAAAEAAGVAVDDGSEPAPAGR